YLRFAPTPVVREGGAIIIPARLEEGAGEGAGEQRFLAALERAESPAAVVEEARRHFAGGEQRAVMVALTLQWCQIIVAASEAAGRKRCVAERLPTRAGPSTRAAVRDRRSPGPCGLMLGSASVIVDGHGRILLVKHGYGELNWELPGGRGEANESAEDTARREAREEVGVELEIDRLTGVYWEPEQDMHHFAFRAASTGEARVHDRSEITEIGWFDPS